MNLASRSDAEDSKALETTCFAELISDYEKECNFKKRDYPSCPALIKFPLCVRIVSNA